jgi:hypothetical protein
MRGGSENDEPLPHPSKRKTSSVADHHPGPLAEPVAPGTKLSCMPSVICSQRIDPLDSETAGSPENIGQTYLPPLAGMLILANLLHVLLEVLWRTDVSHMGDQEAVRLKVVDGIV